MNINFLDKWLLKKAINDAKRKGDSSVTLSLETNHVKWLEEKGYVVSFLRSGISSKYYLVSW